MKKKNDWLRWRGWSKLFYKYVPTTFTCLYLLKYNTIYIIGINIWAQEKKFIYLFFLFLLLDSHVEFGKERWKYLCWMFCFRWFYFSVHFSYSRLFSVLSLSFCARLLPMLSFVAFIHFFLAFNRRGHKLNCLLSGRPNGITIYKMKCRIVCKLISVQWAAITTLKMNRFRRKMK